MADQTYRLLNGYIAYLKQRGVGANEPGANLLIHEERINYDFEVPVESLADQLPD